MGWPTPTWMGTALLALSVAIAYPHFLLSYQLLYSDYRNKAFRQRQFVLVSVVVPLALIALLSVGFFGQNLVVLEWLVAAMYTLVGWHYVKQIYGVMVVIGARRGYSLSQKERSFLRGHLYLLWVTALLPRHTRDWVPPRMTSVTHDFYGIRRIGLSLPPALLWLTYGLVLVSFFGLAFLCWRRYREGKGMPPRSFLVAYLSGLLWQLPLFWYPEFLVMIPIFHGLQYWLFVLTFKKNETRARLEKSGSSTREKLWLSMVGYFGLAVVLGAVGFELLPRLLNHVAGHGAWNTNGLSFVLPFWLFLNLHHYFIDSVLWKGSYPEIRAYLLSQR